MGQAKNYICNVSVSNARMMKELGWDVYTKYQIINGHIEQYNLEQCAIAELKGDDVLYIPTVEQAINWVLSRYMLYVMITPDWGFNIFEITENKRHDLWWKNKEIHDNYEDAANGGLKMLFEHLLDDYYN
jgi:hypothetical protein